MSNDIRNPQRAARYSPAGSFTNHLAKPGRRWRSIGALGALKLGAAVVLLNLGASPSKAGTVPAPPGMGNYCSVTWPNGGWAFASDTNGGDPCKYIQDRSAAGGTIQRKGLYANNNWNRVVYRCYPPNFGFVGMR